MRNPNADKGQVGLETHRQHIAVTTTGMALMGGGRRRLPRNVRNDEIGNWICVGLVVVLLTETLGGLIASFVTDC